ncbi:hypothetical protein SNE40_011591 [Patella caerulea]|uniref:Uncharacterized protein n=1 Tax=Patella caerulea TaxID=87958 RepID=A0AAN8PUA4_PATCE
MDKRRNRCVERDPDDVIDMVARANVNDEHSDVLPKLINSKPCLMHGRGSDRKDLIYSSNYHAKTYSPQRFNTSNIGGELCIDTTEICELQPHNIIPAKRQYPRQLPKELPSKEFVMSWLNHGSEPQGSNHFPEVISKSAKAKNKRRFTPSE